MAMRTRVGASAPRCFSYSKLTAEVADGTRSVADIEISSRKRNRGALLPFPMRASASECGHFFLHRPHAEGIFH